MFVIFLLKLKHSAAANSNGGGKYWSRWSPRREATIQLYLLGIQRVCSFTSWFAPVDSVEPLDRVDDCLELLIGAEFIHGNLNLRAFGADARRDGHSAALAILELAHGIWYRWEYPVL